MLSEELALCRGTVESCCSPSGLCLVMERPGIVAGGKLTIRDRASKGFRAALTV